MSFHLSQTPTLEAVAHEDEQQLAQDLQARVEEGIAQARALPGVAESIAAHEAAAAQLTRLRTAERALHQQAKVARERIDSVSQDVLDSLIDAAANSAKIEGRKLNELAALEDRVRYAGRAIERLAEHLVPLALIASLREEAHALMAEARAMEKVAQQRAEKVLGQIRAAVSDEMVLPIDMSKGVAGALLAQAQSLKTRAIQVSENADGLERKYVARQEA